MLHVFKRYNPGYPFIFNFVDTEYAKKFLSEQRIGKLARLFTALAIFVSCLGLFGLVSFAAEQRTKEIGIRKVLGASVFSLWGILSGEFISLVVVALIVAYPVSYFIMRSWLQNYLYRTEIPFWIFIVTAIGVMLITMLTISYQSIKAALANPAKTLKAN